MTTLRIHFEIEDLANIRIAPTVGPMLEAFFALQHMGKSRSGAFRLWQQNMEATFARRCDVPKPRCKGLHSAADVVLLLSQARAENYHSTSVNGVRNRSSFAELRDFQRAAIAPYWPQMQAYLSQDREQRIRMLASGGFHQLFGTLHPRAEWNLPTLEVPAYDGDSDSSSNSASGSEADGEGVTDIVLQGRGLVVAPSIFQPSPIDVLVTERSQGRHPVLIYSAPPNAAMSSQLWTRQFPVTDAAGLAPLVGRTRAAVLSALETPRTTTELAECVDISAAAASQHATILRNAGLITSRRVRNKVFHGTTPLGRALIGGRLPRTRAC